MRSFLISGAAALALCVALPAATQTTPAPSKSKPPATAPTATVPASTAVNPPMTTDPTMPPATAPAAAATTAPAATPAAPAAATDASATVPITSGLSVKDNTGAVIGQITAVKPDASGKPTATIKMGADSFAVDTSALVVQNGAAVINSSQAELQGMIKKATPPAPPPAAPEATTPRKKK